ncbi:MAG TPA: protein-L-isoaspartate(D-aspartate) O-methyltransferase [Hyphomicrobium sp.]|nr:protein-L-isoaspartate(D-aspartate) O-methyltransferase [Hyphomicrobium sp.]
MTRVHFAVLIVLGFAAPARAQSDYASERRQMIEDIKAMASSATGESGISRIDQRVLAAMEKVPRHEFVPPEQAAAAYKNRPLPIGYGQTISQPFIVALMTSLLELKASDKVLEIGTGSGYQAAVLSAVAREVFSIEIIPELGEAAGKTLRRLGYTNVTTRIGDGYQGWREHAPFDAIIVTAAPDHVPAALVAQLRPNGRMVIPVGDLFQDLIVITKKPDGTTSSTAVGPVLFVPLTREK